MTEFKSTLLVIPFVAKDTEFFPDYFSKRSNEFVLFTFGEKVEIIKFEHGVEKYQRTLINTTKMNKIITIVLNYVFFLYTALFIVKRGSLIFVQHPYFCVGNAWVSFIKNHNYVFRIGDYYPDKTGLMKIYHGLVEYYNKNMRYVYYISPFIAKYYGELKNIDNYQKKIFPNGISKKYDDDEFYSSRIRNNDLRIGYIGILRPMQGTEELLHALKDIPDIQLDIVGVGESLDALKTLASNLNISDRVVFHGFIDAKELRNLTKYWMAGLAPYHIDDKNMTQFTEPSKIKTYLSYGVPVIMTEVSYIYKIIQDHQAGITIKNHDKDSIGKALLQMKNNYEKYLEGVNNLVRELSYEALYDSIFTSYEKN